jgi:hypothetical protein
MEAALTFPILQSRVDVRDGAVSIDGLQVDDRTLAELVERRLEQGVSPEETVTDALEIGARVLDRESTGAEVDFVRREFEKLSGQVERSFAEKARVVAEHMQSQFERHLGEDSGTMAKALDAHADALGEQLTRNFGGERSTAVQNQIRELTAKALRDAHADLLRQFSAQDGHNPLAGFTSTVQKELQAARQKDDVFLGRLTELKGEIQRLRDAEESRAEVDAERERGTAKGRTFEQACFDALDGLAAARGDVAHHVGDERSASGGKLGDVVLELDAAQGECRGRIALEVKDERLSKNKAWEVLNGALVERDAAFAILVVASEAKVPSGREQLHEYEGNKMIVTLDRDELDPRPLELAYRYARCRVLMAGERELELDAAGVRDAAEEALSALRDAQSVRGALTGASNNVDSARKTLDAMVARVQTSLERVESLIGAARPELPAEDAGDAGPPALSG